MVLCRSVNLGKNGAFRKLNQIGEKRRFTIYPTANDHYYKFELRNAKTGTRFTFIWYRGFDGGSLSWKLQKGKK